MKERTVNRVFAVFFWTVAAACGWLVWCNGWPPLAFAPFVLLVVALAVMLGIIAWTEKVQP